MLAPSNGKSRIHYIPHVIAAIGYDNGAMANRAVSRIVLGFPLPKGLVLRIFAARFVSVILCLALGARCHATLGACSAVVSDGEWRYEGRTSRIVTIGTVFRIVFENLGFVLAD